MGTVFYPCGCSISRSMFADNKIMNFSHCERHEYLWSADKTIRQMVDEIYSQTDQIAPPKNRCYYNYETTIPLPTEEYLAWIRRDDVVSTDT